MESRRDLLGHAVAAAGAGALALSLWLPWYSFRIPTAAIDSAEGYAHQLGILGPAVTQAAEYARQLGPLHVSAWHVLTTLPILLLVCAVIGGGLALLAATDRASGVSQVVAGSGLVGILLILFRLVSPPLGGLLLHPSWAMFLGLGGALAMLAGGSAASRAERGSFPTPDLIGPVGNPSAWPTAHSVPPPAGG